MSVQKADSLFLKSNLSIKKGLESLSMKKTITFASENEEKDSLNLSKRKSLKKKPKPTQKQILAQIDSRYLSNTRLAL